MKKTYSDGKLDKTDEGDLRIATYIKEGRLIIDFGKDVSWIGFDKKSLKSLLDALEKYYKEL